MEASTPRRPFDRCDNCGGDGIAFVFGAWETCARCAGSGVEPAPRTLARRRARREARHHDAVAQRAPVRSV